jgi:hypothetical protein
VSKQNVVVVLKGTVREKLETLADFYGVDRAAMWTMAVREFAERIEVAAKAAKGRA